MGQSPLGKMYAINPTGDLMQVQCDAQGRLLVVPPAGGDAVSIADGADVTQGAKADAVWDGAAAAPTAQAVLKAVATRVGAAPAGAVPLAADSGNVANAVATATLAAAANKTTYISGLVVTAGGATGAAVVTGTITGLLGGTGHFTFAAPVGALVAAAPLVITFPQPIPASAVNTAIAVALPALGVGNTNATVQAFGFQK